jgi:hypothetical protein
MAQTVKIKVVTGKVRFSYANVFQAKASEEGGTLKYSTALLIPKSDKETVNKINKAIEECKEANKSMFNNSVKGLKGGLRDGDEERDGEEYQGMFFINANSARRPGVVDADMNEIIDPEEFYSGCYGRASLTFYPYDTKGGKGIACGLNNVQKLEDGEKLSGGSSAAEDFAV